MASATRVRQKRRPRTRRNGISYKPLRGGDKRLKKRRSPYVPRPVLEMPCREDASAANRGSRLRATDDIHTQSSPHIVQVAPENIYLRDVEALTRFVLSLSFFLLSVCLSVSHFSAQRAHKLAAGFGWFLAAVLLDRRSALERRRASLGAMPEPCCLR